MSIRLRRKQARKEEKRAIRSHACGRLRPVMEALGLPEDVTGNSVRVILLGDRRALIENYLGVAEVGQEEIRLATRGGVLLFRGETLRLEDVRRGGAAVTGRICAVELPAFSPEGGARS